ncbi:choice-of-anchor I family protein [Acinetobacter corruptisaponis]|uniref:Choice-of-anchor I family protein n=1 Tax=Acinetobacter corruptisaponis TaxID=3045147 RepID=A0ABY8RYW0_9GAMM|nr:choice-of-anchor I family protein [Acinetobacter sp. KCTC 92772]WHP04380.1 choice-of-anchor I family protein [Acinetobacter sp. KCTC 92772]
MKFKISVLLTALLSVGMVGCEDDQDILPKEEVQPKPEVVEPKPEPKPEVEATPEHIQLSLLGRYEAGAFGVSAAEIPAYDPATKRAFIVNAKAGALDVLDLSNPAQPVLLKSLTVTDIAAGATVNSVSIRQGIIAIAIEAGKKTDTGFVAFYQASDLSRLSYVPVGALPDMLTFSPDGQTVLVANEGEPSDDYKIDPEGSISVINVSDIHKPTVKTADFKAFNNQKEALLAKGVRIYGPNASVAQDLEPEYIAVSSDGKTAWASLQENNAIAVIDIATATVTSIEALGLKDHGLTDSSFKSMLDSSKNSSNALDVSDFDGKKTVQDILIKAWSGLKGMYQPDSIAAYTAADNKTYLISANEGDSRAWGETTVEYFGLTKPKDLEKNKLKRCDNDNSKGFVEEWRVKHLVHKDGFDRRCADDLPAHLRDLAAGAHLNPTVFSYCGASKGDAGNCRDDNQLGRLKVTWTQGYQTENGKPVYYSKAGDKIGVNGNPLTDYLMYDALYVLGGRSFSIWDTQNQVKIAYDSGDFIEQYLNSDQCKLGKARNIPCKNWFNSNHEKGNTLGGRSSNKGPEPEGLTIGKIGNNQFLFLGLERMGGVMVFDVTQPKQPIFQDYLNTREIWDEADPSKNLSAHGDLGPEGLIFIAAKDSPNGKPMLIVGNEVSGSTAIHQVNTQ